MHLHCEWIYWKMTNDNKQQKKVTAKAEMGDGYYISNTYMAKIIKATLITDRRFTEG